MTIHSNNTIAILGGAGKAGRPLVREALTAGYHVRLLLRNPDQFSLTHKRLTVIQGDARDINSLRTLLQGCTALVSTLGNPRDEEIPILSIVTNHIIAVMEEKHIHRYITVTSLYTTDKEQGHQPTKQASDYMHKLFPQFMADRQVEIELLAGSNLDWTYVRLPLLVQEPATGRIDTNLDYLPRQQLTVTDLARFLLGQLSDNQLIKKAPFIANS